MKSKVKKSHSEIKQVLVKEWFEKRKDEVYIIWELASGQRIERLTPYEEIPIVYSQDIHEDEELEGRL